MAIYPRTAEFVAGVTAQFTLGLSDLASLKRELAERQSAAEGMN
jgi:hypothetical protein